MARSETKRGATRAARSVAIAASIGAATLAFAFACAPILGIEDVGYGPPPEAGVGNDGQSQSEAGDAPLVCKDFELRCGGSCVNPEGDPRNCGVCGFDCGGGACLQRKCQPEILARGLYSPHGLVTDGEWVYATLYGKDWTLSPNPPVGSVVRFPVDGGVPEGGAPETLAKDLVKPSFIRIVGDRVVWTTNDGLMASLRDGGARVTEPDAGETFELVVDGDLVQAARISGACAVYSWRLPGGDGGAVPPPRPVPCGRWLARDGERLLASITKNAFVDGGGGVAAFARDGTGPIVEYGSRPSWAVAVEGDYIYFTEERPKDGPGSTEDSPTGLQAGCCVTAGRRPCSPPASTNLACCSSTLRAARSTSASSTSRRRRSRESPSTGVRRPPSSRSPRR